MIPSSSMPAPTWFMRQTATLTVRVQTQETSGAWESSDSVTYTALCNLQLSTSGESAIFKRATGTTLGRVFLGATATDGTAISTIITKTSTITIDGVVWDVDGEPIDLCSNGVVYQVNVFRNT